MLSRPERPRCAVGWRQLWLGRRASGRRRWMRRDVNLTNWSANWGQLSCARQPLPVHACMHHTADGCRALALCTCSQATTALAHILHALTHILRAHITQYIACSNLNECTHHSRIHTHSHAFHLRSCFSCARIGTFYIRVLKRCKTRVTQVFTHIAHSCSHRQLPP